MWSFSSKAVSSRLAIIHVEGGPFNPCDKLIHPSTCLKLHPIVGIGSSCVSLHVGAGPTLDDQPNIERPFREPIGGAYEAFQSYFHFWLASKCLGVHW